MNSNRKKKILHIAPINTSSVPGNLVQAEQRLGYESRLLTLFRDPRNYFEDICLDLPWMHGSALLWIKSRVSAPERLQVDNVLRIPEHIPKTWQPHSFFEELLVKFRDLAWRPRIQKAISSHALDQFDIYQLDGGLGLYRQARFIKKMKKAGKKIICCYTGSDLRTRGVIPAIDAIADANFTVEFDHLLLHPDIHHVFFPFDARRFEKKAETARDRIRIGHAPTNRKAKGSDRIIAAVDRLARSWPAELVLIEKLPYERALELKHSCDLFIDQIGDLGYGINALEALAMGIPTATCLAPGFEARVPDHPFIVIQDDSIEEALLPFLRDPHRLHAIGCRGYDWVRTYHDAEQVVRTIHRTAGI